jgi:hypothetical protein
MMMMMMTGQKWPEPAQWREWQAVLAGTGHPHKPQQQQELQLVAL